MTMLTSPMARTAKAGLWIVVFNVISYTGIEINGAYDHMTQAEWDPHANFHAMSGLLWLLTLFAVNCVLLFRYTVRGDRCAWWLVLFIGIGVFGGAVAADPLTGHGLREGHTALATGDIAYWAGWAALLTWSIGILLLWPHVVRAGKSRIPMESRTNFQSDGGSDARF
jgi:hypothetical protein